MRQQKKKKNVRSPAKFSIICSSIPPHILTTSIDEKERKHPHNVYEMELFTDFSLGLQILSIFSFFFGSENSKSLFNTKKKW
jgi:hypothetical protein